MLAGISLRLRAIRIIGSTVYSDARLQALSADLVGKEVKASIEASRTTTATAAKPGVSGVVICTC